MGGTPNLGTERKANMDSPRKSSNYNGSQKWVLLYSPPDLKNSTRPENGLAWVPLGPTWSHQGPRGLVDLFFGFFGFFTYYIAHQT